MTSRRLAIVTSGGDAPGMNAAIRAATLLARASGWDVLGVEHGYRGLLAGQFTPLTAEQVGPIVRRGGTILGSARCPEFFERASRDIARAQLRDAGVQALISIGGNGSLAGAAALAEGPGPRVIGVPASIDNDIGGTRLSIGVDTAMNTIVEACDKICDTADAHDRTFIVEVMGRQCGYLAMTSAIAAGADAVLVPEANRPEHEIVDIVVDAIRTVRARQHRGRRVLVIKAEGIAIATERLKQLVDARMQDEPGANPTTTETRVTVLGHVVRGGRPSAFDRVLASRLGHAAASAAIAGETHVMASWGPPISLVPLGESANALVPDNLVSLGASGHAGAYFSE